MSDLMQRQLDDLGKMTTSDLVQRYEDLHGHKCRTRRRAYLIRKIAWRIQANAEGGLSERARKRAAELADLAEVRVMAPKATICPPQPGPGGTTTRSVKGMVTGDARVPPAGFAVVKEYKGWAGRDVGYEIDDLNRLTQALKGTWGGSSIGTNRRSQLWTLTQTGNWEGVQLNLNPGVDSDFIDIGEYDESRTHSNANEILTRNMNNAGGAEYTPDYNKRGDLLSENGPSDYYQYRYDAFGRVLKVLDKSDNLLTEYLYDALGRRVGWHYDVDADKTLSSVFRCITRFH